MGAAGGAGTFRLSQWKAPEVNKVPEVKQSARSEKATFPTKLTIAAAVRDAMPNLNANYMSDVDITKQFLIKPYNRLGIQREVGVPEAISHLLNISDHYTEGLFELSTSHIDNLFDKTHIPF